MASQTLEFANFVLKFGDHDLLDLVDEIVLPALVGDDKDIVIKNTTYRLREVELTNLGTVSEPLLCVVGRFIRDTVLRRTQIFDVATNSLKDDADSMKSAPSALFCLILNNHKLLYLHETPYAPKLDSFEWAIGRIIRRERDHLIESEHDTAEQLRKRVPDTPRLTYPELRRRYPAPDLEITPMPSEASIQQFLDQFQKITRIEIRLGSTNSERFNGGFFDDLLAEKDDTGAKDVSVQFRNNEAGLSRTGAEEQIAGAAASGIGKVKIFGLGWDGKRFSGDNKNIQVKSTVEDPPRNPKRAAPLMLRIYQDFLMRKIINPGQTAPIQAAKIQSLAAQVRDKNDDTDESE